MFTLDDCKWNFPSNQNGPISGIADSGIETFNGTRIKSLAREICQNSLDANADSTKPTVVQFSLFKIPTRNVPGITDLQAAIKSASQFSINQRNQRAKNFFADALKTVGKDTITCLRISDSNTKGLEGSMASQHEPSPWRDLTKSQGVSDKSGSNGGSFGIGKFAPFACSTMRTVFYSTLDHTGIAAYQGVTRLTSFEDSTGEITQGIGFFGEERNAPAHKQFSLDPDYTRSTSGTDVFIVGFISETDWKEKMIASILDGFLYAVYKGQLVVDVDGIQISQETLSDIIAQYKGNFEEYAPEYYKALTTVDSEDARVFESDILSMGKVTLYLILQYDMHRRVAMVRKTGMKIMDKGHISTLIKFSGLLYIEGEELNEFLRNMENPQHTKWENDRADDPKKADRVKKALNKFIKDCLEQLKNDSADEEINPSVGEYLTEERDENSPEEREENINDNIVEIQKKEPKVRKPQEDDFHIPGSGSADFNDDDGDLSDEGLPGTGGREGDGNPEHTEQGGGAGQGSGSGPNPQEQRRNPAGIAPSKLRIMSDNGKVGSFIISFTPSASAADCSLSFFLSAESDRYDAELISAEEVGSGSQLAVSGNTISGLTFTENTPLKIKLCINYSDCCSMEVRAYGHKV